MTYDPERFERTKNWMDLHDFEAEKCPHCGFDLAWYKLPEWATFGAVFALDGKTYRIVSCGSSNRTCYPHFSANVRAEEIDTLPWEGLPPAPCTKQDVGAALGQLFDLPLIEARDLARALRMVLS